MAAAPNAPCSTQTPAARPSSSAYICDPAPEYTLCAPHEKSGDFFVAIPNDPQFSPASDLQRIVKWFGPAKQMPVRVPPTPDIILESGARLYKVTALLPPTMAKLAGTKAGIYGPNCYMTALAAQSDISGRYERVRGRHVGNDEMDYYLRRDFQQVSCTKPGPFGQIIIYAPQPMPGDSGSHAAFRLSDGAVFDKSGWRTCYPYKAVCANKAMSEITADWQRGPNETHEDRPQVNDASFKTMCYEQKAAPSAAVNRSGATQSKDKVWHQKVFEFYSRRMRNAADIPCSRLSQDRVPLLSVENLWKAIEAFRKRLGFGPSQVLQDIDPEVAGAYLETVSLDWQYQATIGMCAPKSKSQPTNEYLLDLYKRHYVKFDEGFNEECNFYMELWKAPQAFRPQITAQFAKLIGEYDVTKFAKSDGGEGIPYLAVLTRAILSIVPSWRPPADTEIVQPMPLSLTGRGLPDRRKFADRNAAEFCKVRHGEASNGRQCERK